MRRSRALTLIEDPAFYAVAIPAVVLVGFTKAGLGGAVGGLGVPLMTLVIGAPQAVAVLLPILLLMDAMGLWAFRSRVDMHLLRHVVPAGLVGTAIGALTFGLVDERWIRALIGIEAMAFGWQRLREGASAWQGEGRRFSRARAWGWAAVSGFTSFVSHAGGPPLMQFLMSLKLDKLILVGTVAWYFAFINVAKLVPYAWLGLFDATNLGTSLVLLPAVPIGYALGVRFVHRVKLATFVRIAAVAMLLTGAKLSWDALR